MCTFKFHSLKLVGRVFAAAVCAVVVVAGAHGQCGSYSITASSGASIVPGTEDLGTHCDDCVQGFALPFPVSLYGTEYTWVNLSSNGNAQFTTGMSLYNNVCQPVVELGVAVLPHWDDLRTDGVDMGIFTSVSGTEPNRAAHIEWRAEYFEGGPANFELRMFETGTHFEIIYGVLGEGGFASTIGVQDADVAQTLYSCNTGGLITPGTKLTFACYGGPSGAGSASPGSVSACAGENTTLLSVAVTPGTNPPSTGITVTADLSSVGGSVSQQFLDDGTGTFSYLHTVPTNSAGGPRSLPFTVADAQGRSTQGVIGMTVLECPAPECDSIDFNGDELFPDTQDITDFIGVFGGGDCPTPPPGTCGDIDFNNDGLFPDTLDIDSLLSVFSGGACV